jgi:hypothetical protein
MPTHTQTTCAASSMRNNTCRPSPLTSPRLLRDSCSLMERQRVLLVALCALAGMLAYCDRVNLSVAIVDMARDLEWTLQQRGQVPRPVSVTAAAASPPVNPVPSLLAGALGVLLRLPGVTNTRRDASVAVWRQGRARSRRLRLVRLHGADTDAGPLAAGHGLLPSHPWSL